MALDSNYLQLEVQGRIQQMADKMLEQDPLLPVHLGAIHSTLIQHEELVHLLSDDDITKLVAAQIKHSGVQLVKEAVTRKTGPKSVPRGQSIADDL